MRWLLPWWWSHRHQSKEREREATEELAVSQELLDKNREQLRPLARATQRNMFSDMIRDALEVGYRNGSHAHGRGK